MKAQQDRLRCPVCGMRVAPDALAVAHQGMHFAFCSQQCRDRFLARPGLYVGRPGHPAPRQRGEVERRRRRIHLDAALDEAQARSVIDHLASLMGVESVVIRDRALEITYDLLQVSLSRIEQALADAGARLGGDWAGRLRRGFVHFVEDIELDALAETPGPGGGCH